MKWDKMTAREKDVLVSEKAMETEVLMIESGIDGKKYPMVRANIGVDDCPHYTTNTTDAWEVIEKFEGYQIDKFISSQKFTVSVFTDKGVFHGQSESFPEAVCKAALKALDINIE